MLLNTLNCDLCRGLCLTFNYLTGAALSEADSGYPSSQGSYNVEGGKHRKQCLNICHVVAMF